MRRLRLLWAGLFAAAAAAASMTTPAVLAGITAHALDWVAARSEHFRRTPPSVSAEGGSASGVYRTLGSTRLRRRGSRRSGHLRMHLASTASGSAALSPPAAPSSTYPR